MEFKILITGYFSSGKTQFIKTLSQSSISSEVKITNHHESKEKEMTTVAMDYGKIIIDGKKIHLFGTPGQERFDFMVDILANNHDGAVVLIDSSNPESIKNANKFIKFLKEKGTPFVIACNKQDKSVALKPKEIADILNLPYNLTKPLCALNKQSSYKILKDLLLDISMKKKVA